MRDTPIFDALHVELDAPAMSFYEPDGTLLWYTKIYLPGNTQNAILSLAGSGGTANFPVCPAVHEGCE